MCIKKKGATPIEDEAIPSRLVMQDKESQEQEKDQVQAGRILEEEHVRKQEELQRKEEE